MGCCSVCRGFIFYRFSTSIALLFDTQRYKCAFPVNYITEVIELSDSIWSRTCAIKQHPRLTNNIETDICVVGAGMAGILTAYRLQQAGARVTVIDASATGGGQTKNTSVPLQPLSRGKRTEEMKFWWQSVSRMSCRRRCTEYLTLHAARERERVSPEGDALRTAAEKFFWKNFPENLVVTKIWLTFATVFNTRFEGKFFEKL